MTHTAAPVAPHISRVPRSKVDEKSGKATRLVLGQTEGETIYDRKP